MRLPVEGARARRSNTINKTAATPSKSRPRISNVTPRIVGGAGVATALCTGKSTEDGPAWVASAGPGDGGTAGDAAGGWSVVGGVVSERTAGGFSGGTLRSVVAPTAGMLSISGGR